MYSFVEQQTTQQTTTNCNGCQHVERAELIVPPCETESEIQEIQVQVPSRVPMRHRQVIRVPGPAGKVKQVVKRLPTPQPDIIEKLTVLQPQQDVINVITERPFTPPPQIVERRIIEKPLKPIINYYERRVASTGCGAIKAVEAATVEIPVHNLAPLTHLTQTVNVAPTQYQLAPTQVQLTPTQIQLAPTQVQLATAQVPLAPGQVTITQTRPIGAALSPAALSTAALSQAAISTAAISTAGLPTTITNAPLRTQSIYSTALTQRITPTTLTPITYTYARPSVVATPATFVAASPRSATYVRRISDISPIYQTYQSSPVADLGSPTTFQAYSPTFFQGYSTPANTIFQTALPTTTYRQAAALPATTYQTAAALPTISYSPYPQSYFKYY